MEEKDILELEAMDPREYRARMDQIFEDNTRGWVDSNSLRVFRREFRQSPFTQTVLRLQHWGFSLEDSRWAAGQATSRLTNGAQFQEVLEESLNILEARRAA